MMLVLEDIPMEEELKQTNQVWNLMTTTSYIVHYNFFTSV